MKWSRSGLWCLLCLLIQVASALACKKKSACRPPRCPGGCKPKYCAAWTLWWCVVWALVCVARGCKKRTICRPPPGGKPGCGARRG